MYGIAIIFCEHVKEMQMVEMTGIYHFRQRHACLLVPVCT